MDRGGAVGKENGRYVIPMVLTGNEKTGKIRHS
jgi:hypothetical protein